MWTMRNGRNAIAVRVDDYPLSTISPVEPILRIDFRTRESISTKANGILHKIFSVAAFPLSRLAYANFARRLGDHNHLTDPHQPTCRTKRLIAIYIGEALEFFSEAYAAFD